MSWLTKSFGLLFFFILGGRGRKLFKFANGFVVKNCRLEEGRCQNRVKFANVINSWIARVIESIVYKHFFSPERYFKKGVLKEWRCSPIQASKFSGGLRYGYRGGQKTANILTQSSGHVWYHKSFPLLLQNQKQPITFCRVVILGTYGLWYWSKIRQSSI